jgi:hypothetical protein
VTPHELLTEAENALQNVDGIKRARAYIGLAEARAKLLDDHIHEFERPPIENDRCMHCKEAYGGIRTRQESRRPATLELLPANPPRIPGSFGRPEYWIGLAVGLGLGFLIGAVR